MPAAAGLAGCAPAADKAAAGSDAAGAADASAEGAVSTNDVVIKLGDTLPKWSFMVPPAPIPEDEITETIENDIIVVGAGMSGLTTAVAAAEQGGKVTLFSSFQRPHQPRRFQLRPQLQGDGGAESGALRAQPLLLP